MIKSILIWLFDSKKRKLGLEAIRTGLNVLEFVSKNTETKKDDEISKYLNSIFNKALLLNGVSSIDDAKKLASNITRDNSKKLKGVSISVDQDGKINSSLAGLKVGINPFSKKFSIGFNKKF